MVTAAKNCLAMVRFGAFRVMHGGGGELGLVVVGVALLGVIAWAVSRSKQRAS